MELGFQRYPPSRGSEPPPPRWIEEGELLVRRAAPAQVTVALALLSIGALAAVGALGLAWPVADWESLGGGALFVAALALASLCFAAPGAVLLWAVLAGPLPARLRRLEAAWWALALGAGGNLASAALSIAGAVYGS